jgi:hypothetical protein
MPTTVDLGVESSDERFTEWMRENFTRAADHFGVTVAGRTSFGWLLRSISAPVDRGTERLWLRVVTEYPQWASGDGWTGNVDAGKFTGIVPIPRVVSLHQWPDAQRHVRAELMTRLPGTPCSRSNTPPPDLALPDRWWDELVNGLDTLAHAPTCRVYTDQDTTDQRMHVAFGDDVTVAIERWETVHGDLHWNNLFRDPFAIVDWELWGRGPVGTDAATLYLYSLGQPHIAQRVHDRFADVLDSPDGQRAQLYVAARLLHRATFGDHPALVAPLRALSQRLL